MNAAGCGTAKINPPQRSIKQREKCGLVLRKGKPCARRNLFTAGELRGPLQSAALKTTRVSPAVGGGTGTALIQNRPL